MSAALFVVASILVAGVGSVSGVAYADTPQGGGCATTVSGQTISGESVAWYGCATVTSTTITLTPHSTVTGPATTCEVSVKLYQSQAQHLSASPTGQNTTPVAKGPVNFPCNSTASKTYAAVANSYYTFGWYVYLVFNGTTAEYTGVASSPAIPFVAASGSNEAYAQSQLASHGWANSTQWSCLFHLWWQESEWSPTAGTPTAAYGIPQADPGSKMATAGSDWLTDAHTQINWGLTYISGKYGNPCTAWTYEIAHKSYGVPS